MELQHLLDIHPGVTAVIGGGGKTTLLRTLGEELAPSHTVLLCTTTKILPFPGIACARTAEELDALRRQHTLLCAGTDVPGTGKLTVPPLSMAELAARFDYVLVEADGSARLPLKAHAPHEPVIPPEANQVICLVGASGLGRPIAEAAHRPERYAALAGTDTATPEAAAAVLTAEALHTRVLINQADSPERLAQARRLAALLPCPVVLGSLRQGIYEQGGLLL